MASQPDPTIIRDVRVQIINGWARFSPLVHLNGGLIDTLANPTIHVPEDRPAFPILTNQLGGRLFVLPRGSGSAMLKRSCTDFIAIHQPIALLLHSRATDLTNGRLWGEYGIGGDLVHKLVAAATSIRPVSTGAVWVGLHRDQRCVQEGPGWYQLTAPLTWLQHDTLAGMLFVVA